MVEGLVQGVGFRPFIYRLAKKHQLTGNVSNRTDGVVVNVNGEKRRIDRFITEIELLAPPAAEIKNISQSLINDFTSNDFSILQSESVKNLITEISPDIAVCSNCLADLKSQQHRTNYPFINCTNCGPRFSIIKDLPYDRPKTTMYEFQMCKTCNTEYNNVKDRRFHAQPIACNNCGPKYNNGNDNDFKFILNQVVSVIHKGGVALVKGLGGYNLICDAKYDEAVAKIREIKGRETKPFAVMFRDISVIEEYCYLNKEETKLLESWRKPIVLLKAKQSLAHSVNSGLNSVGAMLPYLPFHFLLFEKLKSDSIVYTSANYSGAPIIWHDDAAKIYFANEVDVFIHHNRKIHNPIDDSVIKVVSEQKQIIRRARGYVPNPIALNKKVEGIFAAGAELKNSFCIGKGKNAILSQYIGDLKNFETYEFYKNATHHFFDLFNFKPGVIACDLHPDYLSTQFTEELNRNSINGSRIPIIKVQHHHAHIVSCMAEYQITQKVMGVSFDGTGYGTDGNIWGGEFLICNTKSFERYAHFDYLKMPGGDLAAKELWRMVLSYFHQYSINLDVEPQCFEKIDKNNMEVVNRMLQNNINTPLTSGAGRLFDAVSCLLGLCSRNSFDGEGPMRLESIIDRAEIGLYSYNYKDGIISFEETFLGILKDLGRLHVSKISTKFHNTMVQLICDVVQNMKKDTGINKVVLSGGVFQNSYLLENVIFRLRKDNIETYINHLVPPNDGGIALGQLVVASNYL